MSTSFDNVAELNSDKESWKILVKIVRIWYSHGLKNCKVPLCLDFVAMDSHGTKIHISINESLISKLDNILEDDNVYSISGFEVVCNSGKYKTTRHEFKLNLLMDAEVLPMKNISISAVPFTFCPTHDIFSSDFDNSYLVDTIGMLAGVGSERRIRTPCKKTKINVIEMDIDGVKMHCTLFGSCVDQLNKFMEAGDTNNVVVLLQFAKVSNFEGRISLQSIKGATKLIFNPILPLTQVLKLKWSESNGSGSHSLPHSRDLPNYVEKDDFLTLTPRKTISQIKDSKEDYCCVVLGTILYIDNNDWWYAACKCNTNVVPHDKLYFCEGCNCHVATVYPRFRLQLRISDETVDAPVILFDREAYLIVGKSCVEMIEYTDKPEIVEGVPLEIANIVGKQLLFKLEVRNLTPLKYDPLKLEPAFRVKRICTDEVVLKQFKAALVDNRVGAISRLRLNTPTSSLHSSEVLEDLVDDFAIVSSITSPGSSTTAIIDLNADTQEIIRTYSDAPDEI